MLKTLNCSNSQFSIPAESLFIFPLLFCVKLWTDDQYLEQKNKTWICNETSVQISLNDSVHDIKVLKPESDEPVMSSVYLYDLLTHTTLSVFKETHTHRVWHPLRMQECSSLSYLNFLTVRISLPACDGCSRSRADSNFVIGWTLPHRQPIGSQRPG